MIQPLLADDALLEDVARARSEPEALHLWWLGQSGFLLQWQGRHLLADPYLSDSLTRKYAGTTRPHVRLTARAVAPERLAFVDVVTASHLHSDHFDPETLRAVAQASPGLQLIVPEAMRALALEQIGLEPAAVTGLDDRTQCEAAGFRIVGVPAAHERLDRDEAGRHRCLGYVIHCGPWAVYHAGDTVRHDGLAERLRPQSIAVALLPINGRHPGRSVAGNLDGREAAALAREIGAALAIPCHYEMFEFNTASPDPFAAEARRIGQSCRVLRCGERWSSSQLGLS